MSANQVEAGALSPARHRMDGARAWCAEHPLLSWSLIFSAVFLVAGVSISRHAWYPVLDLAMTEFRVRDVGTSHTPLVGLPGRLGYFPDQGSHPGPLSFYALALVYKLSGSSAHGLEYATILLSLAAVITALWLAMRRGGPGMTVALRTPTCNPAMESLSATIALVCNLDSSMVCVGPRPGWMVALRILWCAMCADASSICWARRWSRFIDACRNNLERGKRTRVACNDNALVWRLPPAFRGALDTTSN